MTNTISDEEMRLECIKSAAYLMTHRPVCIFNKTTYHMVESPVCLADTFMYYIKTGSLVYLNQQEIAVGATRTPWEKSNALIEELRDQLEQIKKRPRIDLRRRQ